MQSRTHTLKYIPLLLFTLLLSTVSLAQEPPAPQSNVWGYIQFLGNPVPNGTTVYIKEFVNSSYYFYTTTTVDGYYTKDISADVNDTVYVNVTYFGFSNITADMNSGMALQVNLDTSYQPSNLQILIEGGATYVNRTDDVNLNISAQNAENCSYSNNGTDWSDWETYSTTKAWNLSSGADGIRTVYYRCQNVNGTSGSVSDSIIVDSTAPSNLSISINSGSKYTYSTQVTLSLNANDSYISSVNCSYMNDGESWSSYSAYVTSRSWTLRAENGNRTVSYTCIDGAGNIGGPVEDSILYDNGTISLSLDKTVYEKNETIIITATVYDPSTIVNSINVSGSGVSGTIALSDQGGGVWNATTNAQLVSGVFSFTATEYDSDGYSIRNSNTVNYQIPFAGVGGGFPQVYKPLGRTIDIVVPGIQPGLPTYGLTFDTNLYDFKVYVLSAGSVLSVWDTHKGDIFRLPRGSYEFVLIGTKVYPDGTIVYYSVEYPVTMTTDTFASLRMNEITESEYNALQSKLKTDIERRVISQTTPSMMGGSLALIVVAIFGLILLSNKK